MSKRLIFHPEKKIQKNVTTMTTSKTPIEQIRREAAMRLIFNQAVLIQRWWRTIIKRKRTQAMAAQTCLAEILFINKRKTKFKKSKSMIHTLGLSAISEDIHDSELESPMQPKKSRILPSLTECYPKSLRKPFRDITNINIDIKEVMYKY